MSKTENLKLKDVEVLDESMLKMTTYSFGSSPNGNDDEYSSYFGSDEEYGSNWATGWPCNCPEHDCDKNEDCENGYGSRAFCMKDAYCGPGSGYIWWTYRKCRAQTEHERVCYGQPEKKYCWVNGVRGVCSWINETNRMTCYVGGGVAL